MRCEGSAHAARGRRGRRAEGGETRILRQKRGDEMRSAKRVRMPHAARRTPRAASRPTRARASRAKAGDGRKRKEARALVLPSSCVAFRLRSAQSFLKRSSNSSESSWHRKGGGNHQENGVRKERACHHEGDLRVRWEGWEEGEGGGGEGCGWDGGHPLGRGPLTWPASSSRLLP